MPLVEKFKPSRAHFQGLDFLRGVAAIVVVMFHFSTRLTMDGLVAHGYLAVDFFFALSGFVIDRAYGARLRSGELSYKAFFFVRIIRLWPLIIFGTLLAAFIDLFRQGEFSVSKHAFDVVLAGLMGCLCLPTFWDTTLEHTTFPLNGPVWSLNFELVSNFCFIPIFRAKNSNNILLAVAIISFVTLCAASVNAHTIDFGLSNSDYMLGFPRVCFSYSVGILLSRVEIRVPHMNKWLYAAILVCVLSCPELPGHVNTIFDLLNIAVIFPLVLLGAAHCKYAQEPSALSKWSGNMSYPLYTTHYPIVRAVGVIGRRFIPLSPTVNFVIAMFSTIILVILASIIYTLYDVPMRRWLSKRRTNPKFRIGRNTA